MQELVNQVEHYPVIFVGDHHNTEKTHKFFAEFINELGKKGYNLNLANEWFTPSQDELLNEYTDNKFKGTSSVSSTVNKTKVSESSGGINIIIHNHYGNQTTEQIKETNTDLSQKIKKVLSEEEDRKRRVSLA